MGKKTVTYEIILDREHADELEKMSLSRGIEDDLTFLNDVVISLIDEKCFEFVYEDN